MTAIDISRIHFPVQALGPGKRIGVWLKGCSIRCPGCISLDTWDKGKDSTTVSQALETMATWAEVAEGLTVSGGEPLDQPEALAELLRGWREISSASVLLFTGRSWADASPWFAEHPGLVDAVIAEPYVRGESSTQALRGSDNQRLHVLTPVGEQFQCFDRKKTAEDYKLDVMFDEDGSVWFAGIPSSGDFERLRDLLSMQGHAVLTSAQSRQVAQ